MFNSDDISIRIKVSLVIQETEIQKSEHQCAHPEADLLPLLPHTAAPGPWISVKGSPLPHLPLPLFQSKAHLHLLIKFQSLFSFQPISAFPVVKLKSPTNRPWHPHQSPLRDTSAQEVQCPQWVTARMTMVLGCLKFSVFSMFFVLYYFSKLKNSKYSNYYIYIVYNAILFDQFSRTDSVFKKMFYTFYMVL